MNTVPRLLVPFLCAFLAGPAFIFLHEWGHYIMARSLGWRARMHYAETKFDVPSEKFSPRNDMLVSSAGPFLGAVVATAGFVYLHRSRRHRPQAIATFGDWVATTCVLNVGRWLRCFAGSPSRPVPDDEAYISRAMGLPGWFLPYFLGVVAIIVIVATIRLHPPRARLVPFLASAVGGVAGAVLWMNVAGPILLP
jgi:hypothetical protein